MAIPVDNKCKNDANCSIPTVYMMSPPKLEPNPEPEPEPEPEPLVLMNVAKARRAVAVADMTRIATADTPGGWCWCKRDGGSVKVTGVSANEFRGMHSGVLRHVPTLVVKS